MAGDWIKVEHVTADKPEIYRIANALGVTAEDVLGRCLRIWIWADQQSLDGHAIPVTFVTLDSIARRDGFAKAMKDAGWLMVDGNGSITFPNFERHNGKTSKDRALATDRKRKERGNRDIRHDQVTPSSRSFRDDDVTREEKRREEDSPPSVPPVSDNPVLIPPDDGQTIEAEAVRLWNAMAECHGLAVVQNFTSERRSKLRARLLECGGLDGWRIALERVAGNPWFHGENDRGWKADFDFLLQKKSFTKLMEGSYARGPRRGNSLAAALDRLQSEVVQ